MPALDDQLAAIIERGDAIRRQRRRRLGGAVAALLLVGGVTALVRSGGSSRHDVATTTATSSDVGPTSSTTSTTSTSVVRATSTTVVAATSVPRGSDTTTTTATTEPSSDQRVTVTIARPAWAEAGQVLSLNVAALDVEGGSACSVKVTPAEPAYPGVGEGCGGSSCGAIGYPGPTPGVPNTSRVRVPVQLSAPGPFTVTVDVTTAVDPCSATDVHGTGTASITIDVVPPGGDKPQAGPDVNGSKGSWGQVQAALDSARSRWASTRPAAGYRFVYDLTCFCGGPDSRITTVDGSGGASTVATDDGTGRPTTTVEGLFDEIQRAVDDDVNAVRVQFDVRYGFPTSYYIDPDAHIADEEHGINVRWFAAG